MLRIIKYSLVRTTTVQLIGGVIADTKYCPMTREQATAIPRERLNIRHLLIKVLSLTLFCILDPVSSIRATTINALSCSRADVLAALSIANNNDTVIVPAGNCTWTASASITHGITLQGAGQGVSTITLNNADWLILSPSGGVMRISGFTVTGTNGGTAAIQVDGSYTSFRMDHMTFTNVQASRVILFGYQNWPGSNPAIYGLIDHITLTATSCGSGGFGLYYGKDDSWLNPDDYGSVNSLYIEDSTFTFNVSSTAGCVIMDQEHGARVVIRHNTITNGTVLGHDTGSTQQSRGRRKFENYANTFTCTLSDCGFTAFDLRGGTGVFFDNKIPLGTKGYQNAAATEIWRISNGSPVSAPWAFQCNQTQLAISSDFKSHCSAGDHRACGFNESVGQACTGGGTGTCVNSPANDAACGTGNHLLLFIDGTSTAGGYPCRDQVGRGQDTGANHSQPLAPDYWVNNTDSNNGDAQITTINVAPSETAYIQANREYYSYTASFNGTSGVGRSLLSARPATCTPFVGYYATDTGVFYQCSATNTWSSFWRAFAYPHPLQSGTTAVAPPTNLQVIGIQ